MKKLLLYALTGALCVFVSCNKDEGEGGTASISGYIYKVVHSDDDFSLSSDTIPAAKEDVFIYYGNEKSVGDKTETGPDGYFTFKYLTKGNYQIFAYSTYDSGVKEPVAQSVKLSRGEDAVIPTIYIHEGKAYGNSVIKGKVLIQYYLKDQGCYYPDEKPMGVGDVRVYISRKGESEILDDVRTSFDGTFVFQRLTKGEYTIYVYSADMDLFSLYNENIQKVLSQDVVIDEMGQIVNCENDFEIFDIK